jgi:2,4-dienoyl-CoA reductase (NADPH2)
VCSPREPVRPRALTDGEVDAIVEGFRVSAVNALAAGFQVIELHAAHGYLLGQFLSAVTNRRPGAGALAARARIIARITDAIRGSALSAVIGIRLSTDGGEEAGLTMDGLCELLPQVSPHVDYINLTVGVRTTYVRDMATTEPPLLPHLARIRPLTSRPLTVSQAFRRGDQIDAALAAGADLVGMARPLIADPDLPAKLLSGRAAQVRPCVSCNEDCRTFDPVLLCSVNPELAPDGAARRPAAPLLAQQAAGGRGDRVAIVGAGPAGLECAVSLAAGGALAGAAEVVVFDQRDVIGGQLAVAGAAPNRTGWQALLDFYQASLDAADGVTLRLGVTAGPADLAGFGEVILAVGSEEVLPEVPGIERALASSRAIASGTPALADRDHLLIVDDGFGNWSCASAVELGVHAAVPRITVATPGAAFGASLPPEGRVQLIARLRGAALDVLPFTTLSSVSDGCAELSNTMSGATTRIAADAVIVVGERRAHDWRSLVPSGPTVRVIGDALVPRRVAHAISEGRAAAEAIRASRAHAPVTAESI